MIEQKVLSCIYNQQTTRELLQRRGTKLRVQYFLDPYAKRIANATFTHYREYNELPTDVVLRERILRMYPKLDVIDHDNIGECIDSILVDTTPGGFEYYRDELIQQWIKNTAREHLSKAIEQLENRKLDEFKAEILSLPRAITSHLDGVVRIDPTGANVASQIEHIKYLKTHPEEFTPVPSGIPWLDEHLNGGWQKGETYLLFAYTGRGKSFAGANFAYHAVWRRLNVVIFTLEMRAQKAANRFYSRATGIPHRLFFQPWMMEPDQMNMWEDWMHGWDRGRFEFISFKKPPSVASIEAEILSLPFDPDLVIIDQMTDIATSLEWQDMAAVSQGIQFLAKSWDNEKGLPVVYFGQAKTKTEWEKALYMSDFAYGKPACDNASMVLYLAQTKQDLEEDNILRLGIAKHRDDERPADQTKLYPNFEVAVLHDIQRAENETLGEPIGDGTAF